MVETSSSKYASFPKVRESRVRSVFRLLLALAVYISRRISRVRRSRLGQRLYEMRAPISLAVALLALRGTGTLPLFSPKLATVAAPALPPALTRVLPEGVSAAIRPFTESFGVVFLSEFGDKSMFATALMAMKHSPFLVLVGALAALTLMTLIACFLGQLMHLLPPTLTHYASIALFVFFGFQLILQSRSLPDTPGAGGGERADAEQLVAGVTKVQAQSSMSVLAKISSLIFVAEWCDRSMLATMALAASSNTAAVVGGATLANIVCTGMAVSAAALVASRISERTVALVSGILFEFFAVFTYFEGPETP